MSANTYHIRPAWPDFMVYEDEQGRVIQFNSLSMQEPPHVEVEDADRWQSKNPPWASEQRDLILSRLRKAGCILHERGAEQTVILSPDETFQVQQYSQQDERLAPWEGTTIVSLPGREVMVNIADATAAGLIRFPGPGKVVLSLQSPASATRIVEVNVAQRLFRFDEAGEEIPLQALPGYFARSRPEVPVLFSQTPTRVWVRSLFYFLASLLMTAGSLLVLIIAKTPKDRGIAILGIVLFGACLLSSYRDFARAAKLKSRA